MRLQLINFINLGQIAYIVIATTVDSRVGLAKLFIVTEDALPDVVAASEAMFARF
jgi:hypothetical protein